MQTPMAANYIVRPDQPAAHAKPYRIDHRQYLTPKETMHFLGDLGIIKATYPLSKMLILSIQAGMFKAIAGYVGLMIAMGCPELTHGNPGLKKLLFALPFPVGLILVNIYGAELFTGSVMVLPPSYLVGKIKFRHMLKSLLVVFAGNFMGGLFVAYFLGYLTDLPSVEPWRSGIVKFAEARAHAGFRQIVLRGIGCNFMICLGTYGAMSALDITGKAVALYLPSFTFSAIGFEHSVANMFLIPLAMLEGAEISVNQFLVDSIIGSTIGNIIGGGIFVGLAAWAVHADVNILTYKLGKMFDKAYEPEVEKAVQMEMGSISYPSPATSHGSRTSPSDTEIPLVQHAPSPSPSPSPSPNPSPANEPVISHQSRHTVSANPSAPRPLTHHTDQFGRAFNPIFAVQMEGDYVL